MGLSLENTDIKAKAKTVELRHVLLHVNKFEFRLFVRSMTEFRNVHSR